MGSPDALQSVEQEDLVLRGEGKLASQEEPGTLGE